MADSYVAAKIRKFVFSKALGIFAANKFVTYVDNLVEYRDCFCSL